MRAGGTLRGRCQWLSWVMLVTLPMCMPVTVEATGTIVRIYPTAIVNADQVTLADIAQLTGDGAELAGGWALTAAPACGQELTLDQDSIQKALVRKGINPSMWIFRGSTRCRIARPMPVRGQADAVEQNAGSRTPAAIARANEAVTATPADAATTATAGTAAAQPQEPAPDSLEAEIYRHISGRLSKLGGKPSVRLSPALRDLLHLSRPAYEFSIADRSDRLLGLVPFDITISRAGEVEQVRSILAEVSLVKTVIVATGPINRGQTIGSQNVTLREQTFDRPDRTGMSDINAVVGQRALRLINSDEMVTGKDIEPVPFILRNDLVSVTARRGSITIQGVAKAMEAAGYGDPVALRNESSKQTFMAVVTGPKTAEMIMDNTAVPSSLAMAGGND